MVATTKPVWEIRSAQLEFGSRHVKTNNVQKLLKEGWEPFAVDNGVLYVRWPHDNND